MEKMKYMYNFFADESWLDITVLFELLEILLLRTIFISKINTLED